VTGDPFEVRRLHQLEVALARGGAGLATRFAAVSAAIVLAVAIVFGYWEGAYGKPHLFWFVIGFGVFAVLAMWVFPEAVGAKGKINKGK
jgi:hypothetical protein